MQDLIEFMETQPDNITIELEIGSAKILMTKKGFKDLQHKHLGGYVSSVTIQKDRIRIGYVTPK